MAGLGALLGLGETLGAALDGLGPTEANRMAGQFGILPFSSTDREGLTQSLASLDYLPGTSGVGDEARSSARQAARYGAIEPTAGGVSGYGMQLSQVMENAVARGMDRASVLHSIDASVAMAARSGAAGVDAAGLQGFLMRFSNLPGGKTGEIGLQAMGGLQAATDTIGQNPMRTMMAVQAAHGIKNEQDLQKFLGPEAFAKTSATPEGKALIQNFLKANAAGDSVFSAGYLQDLTAGNPAAQAKMFTQSQFYRGLSDYMVPKVAGRLTNLGTLPYLSYSMNPGSLSPGPQSEQQAGTATNASLQYDRNKSVDSYKQGLLRMGVRPDLVDVTIQSARMAGVDPLLVGGVMMQESTGGKNKAAGVNVMQIDPSSGMPIPKSEAESIAEGAMHLRKDMAHGENLHDTLRNYNGPAMDRVNPNYVTNVQGWMTAGGANGNIPTDMLNRKAEAGQASMEGSSITFSELNIIIPAVNKNLEGLAAAAGRATAALSRLGNMNTQVLPMPSPY